MKKVVLVSVSGYDSKHDQLLKSLIDRKIVLFCAVGVQCEMWHDVMDELIVGPYGKYAWHINTTWHEGESVAEVIEFAENFHTDNPTGVEVIEV